MAKPFFEIFSHARVYVRGDDENKKIYFLYIFLFFYFTLFYLLVLKQPLLVYNSSIACFETTFACLYYNKVKDKNRWAIARRFLY